MRLYIGMTKSKSSASSVAVSSIFVIHLVNGAQFLSATCAARLQPAIVALPLNKM